MSDFVQPDFAVLDSIFNAEDACEEKFKQLYHDQAEAKKQKDSFKLKEITEAINAVKAEKKQLQKAEKAEMDKHAYFSRAAKVFLDAQKIIKEKENYEHFEELEAKYEQAKLNVEAALQAHLEEQKRLDEEKAAAKAAKKSR